MEKESYALVVIKENGEVSEATLEDVFSQKELYELPGKLLPKNTIRVYTPFGKIEEPVGIFTETMSPEMLMELAKNAKANKGL